MIRLSTIFLVSMGAILNVTVAAGESIPEKMRQGLAHYEAGDLDGAESVFKTIIGENPNHGPARLMLGQICLQRGELENAEEHLRIATSSNPQRIHLAWQLLGKVHLCERTTRRHRPPSSARWNSHPVILRNSLKQHYSSTL